MQKSICFVRVKLFQAAFVFVYLCGIMLLVACEPAQQATAETNTSDPGESTPAQIIIEAESFTGTKGEMKVETMDEAIKYVVSPSTDSWLAFDVNVPVAGRYKFELLATTATDSVSAWMEDYVDNKDDRTYNITGSIPIPANEATSFSALSKDGSPLNKGLHKMKLHLKGGSAKIDKIRLSLMKAHQLTPQTLTQKTDGKAWKVVWSDEFETDGLPDTSKWIYDVGDWGWGNNELQYYTENRLENARVENGNLIIEARKNDMGKLWTSARLTTRGKVTFLYGRIEFKAKVPAEKGNWAAGWTLGDEYVDELSWPYCGEIDILESVGYEVDNETGDGMAHASAHTGAFYFKKNNHKTGTLEVKDIHNQFHIYAVDWSPEGIVASVDGKEYFTYNDTSNELAWPFDKPQNIILNLAMGGGWGGARGMDESVTSQQFILDYVRVYERQ